MSLLKSSVRQNNRTHEKQVQTTALAFFFEKIQLIFPACSSDVYRDILVNRSIKAFCSSLIPIANGLIISLTVVEGV